MNRLWVHGISGKMGRQIAETCEKTLTGCGHDKWILTGGSSKKTSCEEFSRGLNASDIILDFSSSSGNQSLFQMISSEGIRDKKILIGSTGLNKSQLSMWKDLAAVQNLTVLHAVNTSLGIYLTIQAALKIGRVCSDNHYDLEVEETHHKNKLDSPSGTACFLAHTLADNLSLTPNFSRNGRRQENEIGVQATRGGGVFGEHKIRFLGEHDEITISHRAFSRDLFVRGAFILTKWLKNREGSCLTTLDDIEPSDLI